MTSDRFALAVEVDNAMAKAKYTCGDSTHHHIPRMVHRNLDWLDRILRFALAFWWIGPWAPQYANEWVNWAIFVVGWIALAEAFLGWCALHALFGIHDCDGEECA